MLVRRTIGAHVVGPQPVGPARVVSTAAAPPDTFTGVPVREVPLDGPITDPNVQISGMAWHGDRLLLLPQFATSLFVLERAELLANVDGRGPQRLSPKALPIQPTDYATRFPGFEGFEAIALVGDRAFFLVEARVDGAMCGYLVEGRVGEDGVVLDLSKTPSFRSESGVANMAFEALTVVNDRLLVLPEVNGCGAAKVFDLSLERLPDLPMPPLEYRLTDATPADQDGAFWVANYNHPGDEGMPAAPTVEQVVPLRATATGVEAAGAPLRLELLGPAPEQGRNWEALAPLGDAGFLVMTDQFPRSILGFVPRPNVASPVAANQRPR